MSLIITIAFTIVFLLPLYIIHLIVKEIERQFVLLIEKSKTDIQVRNTVLSILYSFMDMGPGVASFSILALVVYTEESVIQLVLIFFLGLLLKELARFAKSKFYEKLKLDEAKGDYLHNERGNFLTNRVNKIMNDKRSAS